MNLNLHFGQIQSPIMKRDKKTALHTLLLREIRF